MNQLQSQILDQQRYVQNQISENLQKASYEFNNEEIQQQKSILEQQAFSPFELNFLQQQVSNYKELQKKEKVNYINKKLESKQLSRQESCHFQRKLSTPCFQKFQQQIQQKNKNQLRSEQSEFKIFTSTQKDISKAQNNTDNKQNVINQQFSLNLLKRQNKSSSFRESNCDKTKDLMEKVFDSSLPFQSNTNLIKNKKQFLLINQLSDYFVPIQTNSESEQQKIHHYDIKLSNSKQKQLFLNLQQVEKKSQKQQQKEDQSSNPFNTFKSQTFNINSSVQNQHSQIQLDGQQNQQYLQPNEQQFNLDYYYGSLFNQQQQQLLNSSKSEKQLLRNFSNKLMHEIYNFNFKSKNNAAVFDQQTQTKVENINCQNQEVLNRGYRIISPKGQFGQSSFNEKSYESNKIKIQNSQSLNNMYNQKIKYKISCDEACIPMNIVSQYNINQNVSLPLENANQLILSQNYSSTPKYNTVRSVNNQPKDSKKNLFATDKNKMNNKGGSGCFKECKGNQTHFLQQNFFHKHNIKQAMITSLPFQNSIIQSKIATNQSQKMKKSYSQSQDQRIKSQNEAIQSLQKLIQSTKKLNNQKSQSNLICENQISSLTLISNMLNSNDQIQVIDDYSLSQKIEQPSRNEDIKKPENQTSKNQEKKSNVVKVLSSFIKNQNKLNQIAQIQDDSNEYEDNLNIISPKNTINDQGNSLRNISSAQQSFNLNSKLKLNLFQNKRDKQLSTDDLIQQSVELELLSPNLCNNPNQIQKPTEQKVKSYSVSISQKSKQINQNINNNEQLYQNIQMISKEMKQQSSQLEKTYQEQLNLQNNFLLNQQFDQKKISQTNLVTQSQSQHTQQNNNIFNKQRLFSLIQKIRHQRFQNIQKPNQQQKDNLNKENLSNIYQKINYQYQNLTTTQSDNDHSNS